MKWIEAIEQRKEPMSVKEAAKTYGDSTSSFYRKIRRGEIPGVFREPGKPRGRIKICPAEFAAWLRSRLAAGSGTGKLGNTTNANIQLINGEPRHDKPEASGSIVKREVSPFG